ncbi:fibronectin type III domain-containing protein [Catalinimonas sp. 4WD22]|uniref:fibronectin type III domain-containing protein n=1 Tax=Catalinimonas locisalis TaxID=3133978 RepID=UPI0031019BEB
MTVYSKIKSIGFILTLLLLSYKNILGQEIIFSDNFEEGSFLSQWQINPGQPNGVIEVFPTEGLEGNYAVRIGKSKDDTHTLNRLDLPLDLSGNQQFMLQFVIYSNHEESHVQDGIFLSVDGGTSFEKIFAFEFDQWPQKYGASLPPINLNALARAKGILLSEESIIRFQQYGKDDFNGGQEFSDGIYLDHVEVLGYNIAYASLPFFEDFSNDKLFQESSTILTGNAILSDSSDVISPAALVEIVHFDNIRGNVLRMGSKMDKSPATNALDIHLNLASYHHAKLQFDIYDNRDETHAADGIFFSDNGGLSFRKVYAFDADHWSDDHFGSLPPLNINELAQAYGLKTNERFVIRFQQHDDDDFEGSRLSSDGIMIDNIRVYDKPPVYASLPLHESFEDKELAPYWQVGFAAYDGSVKPNGIVEVTTMKDGNRAVRLGSSTDKSYTTNALDLYIDMEGHHEASLNFDFYDNYDESHPLDGIFFSSDGGRNFKKVFDFDCDNWTDGQFGDIPSLSIAQLAKQQNLNLTQSFVVRFQQYDDDDFEGTRTISDGIYLDNISITDPVALTYQKIPFSENFEDTLGAHWHVGNPMLTASVQHIKPGGFIKILDSVGYQSSRGLAIGRTEDGKQTTNAIDLHLDLSQQQSLQLNFWLYNNYDMVDKEDGIWLSRDGGKSFAKAWSFPEAKGRYQAHFLNLDSLAVTANIRFSEQYVIRFQQSGDRKFTGTGNLKGGIYLDDISVAQSIPAPQVVGAADSLLLNICGEYFFKWAKVKAAENFHFQVYTYEHGKEVVVQDTIITDASHTVTGLEEDSAYFCRVKAYNVYTSSKWSTPVTFDTFTTFEADLQIYDANSDQHKIVLQANEKPSYEYRWFKNGKPLDEESSHLCTVSEPGEYSVFISNNSCGIMSAPLKIEGETLGMANDNFLEDIDKTTSNIPDHKADR